MLLLHAENVHAWSKRVNSRLLFKQTQAVMESSLLLLVTFSVVIFQAHAQFKAAAGMTLQIKYIHTEKRILCVTN